MDTEHSSDASQVVDLVNYSHLQSKYRWGKNRTDCFGNFFFISRQEKQHSVYCVKGRRIRAICLPVEPFCYLYRPLSVLESLGAYLSINNMMILYLSHVLWFSWYCYLRRPDNWWCICFSFRKILSSLVRKISLRYFNALIIKICS